ncbi:hypothetical protein CcrC1_gp148 [Caulobacter phage C1]|nr:hypothetical protein CcrC1_gp148 [Caulobacter phage C1]UTU08377.1 hypothetical protein CcrC2_gp149 [Caulobacter phage C2]UTU08894.1 hypothetical protein CcrJ4_gp143 [Caulobacter phage J4]UTU09450.1 hypothetical protein CcrBL47_gp164 [Caulobacter phage BL47]UTU10010.1 hypothetical protein CcrRB23_gp148 [Caulobacter phage RB23]WGN97035.1 hypothetical protein [Bertelyvirus sp.]
MASLSKVIQRGVDTAFKAIGDIAKPGTWRQIRTTGTNAIDITGGVPIQPYTDYPLPRVVFARFKQEETDHTTITLNDQKVLFPRQDLPVEPADSDAVIDSKGRLWQVVRVMSPPADAVVICQVRAS